jgi:glycosyltransferase involved in cell wall biosynthesis
VSARWHLVTGEYAPSVGGIARFTVALAEALASRGEQVHVWVPAVASAVDGVTVHQLGDHFGAEARRQLEAGIGGSDIVLLQYTPNALGRRGTNVAFCAWLARLGRRRDVRVVFHEPFFYFARQSPARNALALVHRAMAALLLSASRIVYLSSASWHPLLQPYAFGRRREWQVLPVSVGPVATAEDARVRDARAAMAVPDGQSVVGHFGTYAPELAPFLRSAIEALLADVPDTRVCCIGRGSTEFVAANFGREPRVSATGEVAERDLAPHLCACDLLIAPFGEGVTARRTSLLIALALGRPVVTTVGPHTEKMWAEEAAVVLVRAGDARGMSAACRQLLDDDGDRARLGSRAAAMYQRRFSRRALLDALGLSGAGVVVGTHAYPAQGEGARRQAAAAASLAALTCRRRLALVFPGDACATDGLEQQPALARDSAGLALVPAPRRAVTREVFDALAAIARDAGARYFFFVNGDIRLSQEAVDLVERGDRTAYVFARTNVDADGRNGELLLGGVDGFAVDVTWYSRNAWRFRDYLVGDRTWDNVYAAILFGHADARMVYRPGWLLHERHASRWLDSPYIHYLRYLSALDAQYFRLWCEFHHAGCQAIVEGGGEDSLNAIARRVFAWRPSLADRAVQRARGWKAVVRYAMSRRGAAPAAS